MAVRNVSVLILYGADKNILLQHRSKDAERLPDYWGFFGGGIEAGESPEQALKRELVEELLYNVQHPHLLTVQDFKHGEDINKKYVFVEQYKNQPLELNEGQAMKWFPTSETEKLKMVDYDRLIIKKIESFLYSLP